MGKTIIEIEFDDKVEVKGYPNILVELISKNVGPLPFIVDGLPPALSIEGRIRSVKYPPEEGAGTKILMDGIDELLEELETLEVEEVEEVEEEECEEEAVDEGLEGEELVDCFVKTITDAINAKQEPGEEKELHRFAGFLDNEDT